MTAALHGAQAELVRTLTMLLKASHVAECSEKAWPRPVPSLGLPWCSPGA